ncbi:phosphonate ABC transporter, permease protein PhnE [Roseibium aquae]|uniref:Phosphonate ABC transporter, permease protein PhnE n=1 Tax=Roseibium aquae TaxID=1323746 RepID=A0A916TLE8_9HYPH|nr:phosphonate ABC transporter, permease protein PhnE [Roseibium aquae]GGB56270.1 phosphonate ABC transporter, permease protein PhnE [Roseibium aquae]
MAVAALEQEIMSLRKRRQLYSLIGVLLVIGVVVSGYSKSNSMNSGGFFQGLSQFFDYPSEIVVEAWQSGPAFFGIMAGFLPAMLETLNIAAVATLIGGALAVVLAMASSRNVDSWGPLIPVTRRLMDITRAFPELIIALFLIFILGSSPVPAMIAVALHTAGALGKLFSEVNENIDRKPIEGLSACGANWLQRIRYGVMPQVAPNYLSYFLLRLEINVRASAILGFVGAGGIGQELRRTIGWGQGAGDETAAIFVLLFITIMIIDQVSSYLRGKLVGSDRAH